MSEKQISRRALLRGAAITSAAAVLAACQPKVVEKIVEVEREVPVEVIKEVEVEREVPVEVIKEVEVEKADQQVTVRYHCRAGAVLPPSSEFPTHQNRLFEFNEEHPEIRVIREDIANTTLHDYYVKLYTMIAGGTVGDMTWNHQSDCDHHRLSYEGVLAPIDDYMESDGVSEDEWWEAGMANARFEGKLTGLPMCTHPGCQAFLFFNQTMFEEAGLRIPNSDDYTIEELHDACAVLTKGDPTNREVYGLDPFHRFSGSQTHEGWMRAFAGHTFVDDEGKTSLMNTEGALEWAKFGYDLYNTDVYAPQAEALPSGGLIAMFAAGRIAAFQSGTWSIRTSLAAVGDNFKEGIELFPIGPAKRGTGNYLDTFAMIERNQAAEVRDATWLLQRAFTDQRCGYLQIKLSGSLPGRGDFMEFDDVASDPIVQISHRAIMEAEPQFMLHNFRGAEHALTMNNLLGAMWLGEQEPTQAYMESVQKACQDILDRPR